MIGYSDGTHHSHAQAQAHLTWAFVVFRAGDATMTRCIHRDITEVAALHRQLLNALDQIDRALDRRDRRAFRIWSGCYRDRASRCGTLLLALATKR